jgi:hypothetical protein
MDGFDVGLPEPLFVRGRIVIDKEHPSPSSSPSPLQVSTPASPLTTPSTTATGTIVGTVVGPEARPSRSGSCRATEGRDDEESTVGGSGLEVSPIRARHPRVGRGSAPGGHAGVT